MTRQLATLGVVLSCGAAIVRAQSTQPAAVVETVRPERPFRGLFGDVRRPESDRFDLQCSVMQSYDDNVFADEGSQIPDPRVNTGGFYSLGWVNGTYHHAGRRFSAAASGASSMRYYASMKHMTSVETNANVHLKATLGSTTLTLAETAQRTPFYSFRFFPTVGGEMDAAAPEADHPIRSSRAYRSDTSATITQAVSTRGELSASYGLRYTQDVGGAASDFTAHAVRVGYRHRTTRYAALRAEYGVEQGGGAIDQSGQSGRVRIDTLDLGVDYRRPLSFSRRTVVDFGAGSSAARGLDGARVYRLLGNAGLTHEIGRTWSLRAAFNRGTSIIEGVAGPALSDAATLSLGGFVNRRIDVQAQGSFSAGEIGVTGGRNPFDTRSASGRVRVALTRSAAFVGEYAYYQYQFRTGSGLAPGLPRDFGRRSVRVGLNLFLPLID